MRVFRVLMVEDDALLRMLLRTELEGTGRFRVVAEADNGKGGVAKAREAAPELDLVLLDLNMPIMDGVEALPLIRQAAPRATVVVLTMRQASQSKATVMALGAAAYLDKSQSGDALARNLLQILDPAAAAP